MAARKLHIWPFPGKVTITGVATLDGLLRNNIRVQGWNEEFDV